MPQIAVSVDMLDTGIDVPDVLNLVFFKRVKSKVKFWQMIGRGTRLSTDIYGHGKDKDCFYIYDWCKNFQYFNQNPNGEEAQAVQSLTERLFCLRTDILVELQHAKYQQQAFTKGMYDEIKERLQSQVMQLKDNIISVRQKWDVVDKYRNPEKWQYISLVDAVELKSTISPILIKSMGDAYAMRFDVLMLSILIDFMT